MVIGENREPTKDMGYDKQNIILILPTHLGFKWGFLELLDFLKIKDFSLNLAHFSTGC